MSQERELATRERLRTQELRLHELIMNFPEPASGPSEDLIAALVELEDLRSDLRFLQDDSSDPMEPDALVGAPIKPLPGLNSGAVALPEPDVPEQ